MKKTNNISPEEAIRNSFIQGYACCLVALLRMRGTTDTETNELFWLGIGHISVAINAGVDESDLEELRQHYPENYI